MLDLFYFLLVACPDGILVVEDVSPVALRPPSGAGRKLYISSTRSSTPATPTVSGHRLRKLVRDIIVGDAESEDAAGGGAGIHHWNCFFLCASPAAKYSPS